MKFSEATVRTLAADSHALDVELMACSTLLGDDIVSVHEYERAYRNSGAHYAEDAALMSFNRANELVGAPRTGAVAISPLARAALRAAAEPAMQRDVEEDTIGLIGCMEAELRLVRSLAHLARGGDFDQAHRPAAVLYDVQGEPFGFLKASGQATAYSWRDARVATLSGDRFIPGSSWFEPVFDRRNPLYRNHKGTGLLAVSAPLLKAEFVRFGADLLPPSISYAAYIGATERTPPEGVNPAFVDTFKLRENLYAALHFSPANIAKQVYALLERGRVVAVND